MIKVLGPSILLLSTLALAACGSFASSSGSSGSSSTTGDIVRTRVDDVSELPDQPSAAKVKTIDSAALPGSTHTLYRYDELYDVLGIRAGFRISTDIRSGIRSFTQDAQVNALTDEAYALMIETCAEADDARLGQFKAAKDAKLGTLETYFGCIVSN